MVCALLGDDCYVTNMYHETFIDPSFEGDVHGTMECCTCIDQIKGHPSCTQKYTIQ